MHTNISASVVGHGAQHAEELEHNINVILQDQDVRQRHHPGEQRSRKEECYGGDSYTIIDYRW